MMLCSVKAKLSVQAMKAVGSGEWWASRPDHRTYGESTPDTQWSEGWEDDSTGLGFLGKEV